MPGSFPLIGAAALATSRQQSSPSFLSQFAANPKEIGAISPSSSYLADVITDMCDVGHGRVIVEWGSGTGVFTSKIEEKKPAASPLFAIEANGNLAQTTAFRCPDTLVLHGRAEMTPLLLSAFGLPACDRVVSGLPWASFTPDEQDQLLDVLQASLVPGGIFTTFGYVHSLLTSGGKRLVEKMKERLGDVCKTDIVWRNLPPAIVYRGIAR